MELVANFALNNESLDAQFDISELENFDAIFELYAAGTTWGDISGTLSNQTDLKAALDLKANQSELDITNNTVSNLADTVTNNYNTLNNKIGVNTQSITTINGTLATFGDIVTYDADSFATAAQGALADTALQPSDNISELYNDAGYITLSALSGYATENYVTEGLAAKQDTLSAGANIQIVNNTISATDTTYSAGQGISIVNGTISNTQTSAEWGNITGTLSDQTDLQNTLNAKYDASNPDGYTSNVGTVTSVNNISPDSNGNVTITIPSSATWGNITGTLSDQTDLQNALNDKQNTLTAGSNITISNGTISATDTIYTLPSATTSTLGGIIVGNNLSIAADGTLSSTDTTYSQGDGIVISGGSISVSTTIASKTDIGTADITIKENGTAIGTINANATTASYIDISVPTTATEVGALPSSTIIGDGAVIFQKNGTALGTITANQTSTTTVNYTIPTTASDVGALPDTTTIGNGATTIQVDGTSIGTITANQTSSGWVDIGTAITNKGYIKNTAINPSDSNSLTIYGTPITSGTAYSMNIGVGTKALDLGATAIGYYAEADNQYSIGIGYSAKAKADKAIQIGFGTNLVPSSLAVGFGSGSIQLLDGTTGLIPYQRINSLTETRNSGQLKFWTGTKAQYDAIVTKDANILYFCTDSGEIYLGSALISNKTNGKDIGDVVFSLTPKTDAGLHLLDGALLQYGSYKQYIDYMADLYNNTTTKYSNVIKYGSLADSDGVLSGFSFSDWAKLPYLFNPSTSVWEIVVKFTTGNSFGTYEGIIHPLDADYTTPLLELRSGVLTLLLSSNSMSWDITSGLNCGTLQTNTTYWVKIEFTGSAYNVYVSTDGTYSTPVATVSSSANVYCTKLIKIGDSWNGTYYFNGSIDLNGSYININGSRWWSGMNVTGFCSEVDWQTSVSTYGSCGKFVYDSVNNTVRLPKVSDILEGTTDITAVGDLVEAGLPNIESYTNTTRTMGAANANNPTGALYFSNVDNTNNLPALQGVSGYKVYGSLNFDASLSNSIYGNSDTVQPQTIKVLYYIVIANSTKTDIEVDIDEIATDLNGKADVDLTNCTDVANIKMAHNAMPSDTYADLTLGSSGSTYTAPANGYAHVEAQSNNTACWVRLYNKVSNLDYNTHSTLNGWSNTAILPLKKGDTFSLEWSNMNIRIFRFYYAVGSESEVS